MLLPNLRVYKFLYHINEQLTVQMCVFVTGTLCAQSAECHLVPLTLPVLRPELALVRACHIAPFIRHRKAALQNVLLSAGFQNFRVDCLDLHLAQVHNEKAAAIAYLGRSQTDTVRLVQSLVHIVQQLVQLVPELRHRGGISCAGWDLLLL